ncbi:MAG TPA: ABC transporter ATP-binding protein [Planctomycetota bacterium]|nr:ABC transporter ATP-binding protein [Planctomycetota bacterium]
MSKHGLDKLWVLWAMMRGQRLRYVAAMLAMVLGVAAAYLVPWICQIMLDSVIARKPIQAPEILLTWIQRYGIESIVATNIWIAAFAILGVTALGGFFVYLKGKWSAEASETIARNLRDRLYSQLQRAPSFFHNQMNTGDLVQRCTSDVETVRAFLATQVVQIVHAVVLLVTVLPIMLWMSPRMTLVSLITIPPIVAFSIFFFIRIRSSFLKTDEAEGALSARLQENLTGIRVVRAFARQEFECEKFGERNDEYRDRTYRMIVLLAWYWSLSDLLALGQKGAVLIAGAWWVTQGEMTIGMLYAFMVYVNMFLWPVRNMGRTLTDTGKTLVSLGRLEEILNQPPEDAGDPKRELPAPRLNGTIAFENVSFSHKDKVVLSDVSLQVEAGQTLAILGPSGSGKTTLIHLLLRLYEPASGRITVDGRDIREMNRKDLRREIGVVTQEPFLFSKTLRDNIRLGRMAAVDDDVVAAATTACIHDGIAGFEKGYDTLVGERGVTLSGGQRQRVAIARAILKDPSVLVLDDALSAVDTETEALILNALKSRRGRHTTLLIAHRLSTLMHADTIVVLEHGRITQRGTHSTLAKQEGLYRKLWRIQASLEEDLSHELQPDAPVVRDSRTLAVERQN